MTLHEMQETAGQMPTEHEKGDVLSGPLVEELVMDMQDGLIGIL